MMATTIQKAETTTLFTNRDREALVAWTGLAMSIGLLVGEQFFSGFVNALGKRVADGATIPVDLLFVLSDLATYVVAPLFMLLPLWKLRSSAPNEIENHIPQRYFVTRMIKMFLGISAFMILISGTMNLFLMLIRNMQPSIDEAEIFQVSDIFDLMSADGVAVYSIISTCVLSPVAEELIFRGITMRSFRALGKAKAIVYSGLLFGLFHDNLQQGVYAFLVGMIFAYIDICAESLMPSCILHIAINTYNYVVYTIATHVIANDALLALVLSIEIFVAWTGIHIIRMYAFKIAMFIKDFKANLKEDTDGSGHSWQLIAYSILATLLCLKNSFV